MKPLDPAVLTHLRPARGALAVVVAGGIVGGVATVAQAFALGALVVAAVSPPDGGWQTAALAFGAAVLVRTLAAYAGQRAAARAGGEVSGALRQRLLDAARRTDGVAPARLVVLATRGVAGVEPYVTRYLPSLVPAAVLPVLTLAAITWLDPLSGLVVALTLPLIPVFAVLVGLTTRDRARTQWRALEALSGHFLDVVRGLPTLVAHNRAEAQVATIRSVTHRYRRATVDTLRLAFASSSVLELVATLSVALVAVTVGLRLASGSVGFEVALTVLLLAPEAYWPLRRVGAEFHAAAEGTAALADADALLAEAAGDSPAAAARPDSPALATRGLEIGYAGPLAAPLTAPLDLDLPLRGLVAVAGPSGCGKSTLLATLRGELAPLAGDVLVGGTALDQVDPAWWHAQVAWAPQRPFLLADTITANVRLGRPGASDAEVREALRSVGMDDVVRALPDGPATVLGEDGAGLSAGQRARIGLARVVLADRPVVLLDEPSAHLDEETEQVLLDTLAVLARRSLVVVVAHRPAVLAAADRVVRLTPSPAAGSAEPTGAVGSPEAAEAAAGAPADRPATAPVVVAAEDDDARPRWGLRTATVLGALSTASGVALTATAGWLITRASEQPPVLYLMVAIVGVRLFGLARPVLRHAERVLSHDVVLRELAERRAAVFADLVPLVPGRLGPRRGDLLTQVVDDVDALLDDRLRVRQPVVTAVLVGVAAACLAALVSPVAGAVVLAVAATGGLAFVLARRGTAAAEPQVVAHRALLGTRVEELVHGVRELEQWGATQRALDSVRAESDALSRALRRSARAVAAGTALTTVAAGAGVVAVAALVDPSSTTPARLALLLLVPLALADATGTLADAGALAVRARAARERLDRLAQTPPAVTDPDVPAAMPEAYDVAMHHAELGWTERPALALEHLALRPGEHLGVTGPSGSGKSTLAATLVRFIDPLAGEVMLGGTDLRRLALHDVRRRVGLVDDDPHVFASTVAENVRLARPGADDDAVRAALDRASLGPWVDALPAGIHTHVGDGRREVSGGERARLALARSLLADPPVLVLDEPTAHLDGPTARAVADEMLGSAARAGRSIVWITHGTVGLDAMDRVVHLEPGAAPSVSGRALARSATAG
ncbi:thiol reductant ABC exporter subunit CydD [Nocardioides sp. zg-1228]|uniref:thiol reductant ABC exporter subunit CydD n=1 Tax=Nocardioides sp. zg-1228 TaxID=2763008 RepID=UPI0016428478|nr:thiol reductant ABC exporter subunit CydD [Nocardioides sp. zg-1228]MBC2934329.1 thiol reductant ABC exporter subunit CydD [Nocardioides sp. zg-1228]QSF59107.1 thiol reductant ABC exporter subunit CydD [Nocardioides sp. zg-1228]